MSSVIRTMKTAPDRVWEVLADGWLHPLWVVGAAPIRNVDDSWPLIAEKRPSENLAEKG